MRLNIGVCKDPNLTDEDSFSFSGFLDDQTGHELHFEHDSKYVQAESRAKMATGKPISYLLKSGSPSIKPYDIRVED